MSLDIHNTNEPILIQNEKQLTDLHHQ